MKTTILYHANCNDGFSAALAAWLIYKDTATYIPVAYGKEPPDIEPCEQLYLLDFSYSIEQINKLNEKKADQLVILDHHKTAKADLDGLPSLAKLTEDPEQLGIFTHFDMNESGATLAWDFFHPNEPRPDLFHYVKDRDLWTWELPASREFSAGLASHPHDFALWRDFFGREDSLITDGAAILRAQAQRVANICRHPLWMILYGEKVPCVNATSDMSEVGESLCEHFPEAPFSVSYCVRDDGKVSWSLRSRDGFDVSLVAKRYGGGGHQAAAGFTTDLDFLFKRLTDFRTFAEGTPYECA